MHLIMCSSVGSSRCCTPLLTLLSGPSQSVSLLALLAVHSFPDTLNPPLPLVPPPYPLFSVARRDVLFYNSALSSPHTVPHKLLTLTHPLLHLHKHLKQTSVLWLVYICSSGTNEPNPNAPAGNGGVKHRVALDRMVGWKAFVYHPFSVCR